MKKINYLLLLMVLFIPVIASASENDGTCAESNAVYLECPAIEKGKKVTCNIVADISGKIVSGETKTGDLVSGLQFSITSEDFTLSNAQKGDFIYGDIIESTNGFKIDLSADTESKYAEKVTVAKVDVTIPEDATTNVFNYKVTGTDSGNNDEYIIFNADGEAEDFHMYDTCGKLSISSNSNNNDGTNNESTTKNPATGIATSILVLTVTASIISGAVIINKKNKSLY